MTVSLGMTDKKVPWLQF